ncbi:MAG: helix-turn-helix domain-containing protein, partial [Hyphomicrobium sp.]
MAKKKNPTDDKRAPEVIFAEAHDSEVARSVASLAARIWSASSAAIANRLVWARSRSGISLVEAGNAIKLSPQAIQQWESGKTLPTIDRYGELGQIYGIDPIWLSSGIMTTGIDEDTSKVLAKLPRPVATRGRPPSKPMEAKPEAPSLTGVRVPLFNSERRAVDAI